MKTFFENGINAQAVWEICGSFGELGAAVIADSMTAETEQNGVSVKTGLSCHEGVTSRKTVVANTGDQAVTFAALADKICLNGGEWEVYTQFNGWQNESVGTWQPLGTEIAAESRAFRTNTDAAPFMVLWSLQSGRGLALHLIPDAAWEMRARRVGDGNNFNHVEVTLGINSHDLNLTLAPGESIALPEILYYPVTDRTGLDAWKLHRYCREVMPRRHETAILYNTWLCCFDKLTLEKIGAQIAPAAELGAEYFVIDAGWFGNGASWTQGRGDWEENKVIAFNGKMNEIAEKVRENGMKFGIWLELETADSCAEIVKNRPELFMSQDPYLLDFAKPEAVRYAFDTVARLIDTYQAGFFKLDFNSTLLYDRDRRAFSDYMLGYDRFLTMLHETYPDLYISRCASGGYRMNLADGRFCDSYWLSDDQNPLAGMRIVKDTVRRMPPQWIERWATVFSLENFMPTYEGHPQEKIIATDDATWTEMRSIGLPFLKAFLTGGPIGFSCDLTKLSAATRAELKALVEEIKANRPFWDQAECRVLIDSPTVLALEFCDKNFARAEVLIYTFRLTQRCVTVFPVLDPSGNYSMNGETVKAEVLKEDGLNVTLPGRYGAVRITLKKQ